MKKFSLAVLLVAMVCFSSGVVMAAEEAVAPAITETSQEAVLVVVGNKVCPVTGEAVKELGKDTVEYEGKVYNMCCPMCKETFLKDSAKYIAIVDQELAKEAVAEVPVAVETK